MLYLQILGRESINNNHSYQSRVRGLLDEVYISMLKGEKKLQCSYNELELGNWQYCIVYRCLQ